MTPQLKLGKKEAKRDERNFKMAALLKATAVPDSYNFDSKHRGLPTPMFANDRHGDCVIAGRGHQTIRFEHIEQNKILPITDADILKEWRIENGNTEDGLYILDSLKAWRKRGWKAAGKTYKIKAFAQVDPQNRAEVKTTIFSDIGIVTGFALPDSSLDEFNRGKNWTSTRQPPNPYNGHCVLIIGYTRDYLTCITWAKRQKMTWPFFLRYCDEAYGVIDASNVGNVNEPALDAMLEKVNPVGAA